MTERAENSNLLNPPEEPPPFLGTWPRVYLAVASWLALLIALFYVFTWRFAP